MRSQELLWDLRNSTINSLRRADCQGCMHDHGSQKYHRICLTDFDADYYYKEALEYLLVNDLVDSEEHDYLKNIRVYTYGKSDLPDFYFA